MEGEEEEEERATMSNQPADKPGKGSGLTCLADPDRAAYTAKPPSSVAATSWLVSLPPMSARLPALAMTPKKKRREEGDEKV